MKLVRKVIPADVRESIRHKEIYTVKKGEAEHPGWNIVGEIIIPKIMELSVTRKSLGLTVIDLNKKELKNIAGGLSSSCAGSCTISCIKQK